MTSHFYRAHPLGMQSVALLGIWAVVISSLVGLLFTADKQQCTSVAETGYWTGAEADHVSIWQPAGCTTAVYQASDIRECLGNKSITMYGDSTVRQVFYAISEKLQAEVNRSARHDEHQLATGTDVRLKFEWDPYLESPDLYPLLEQKRNGTETDIAILMVGGGLHFAAWRRNEFFLNFTTTMSRLYRPEERVAPDSDMGVYVMPVLPPWYPNVNDRVRHVKPEWIDSLNDWVLNEMQRSTTPSFKKTYLWSYNEMVLSNKKAYDESAIHVTEAVAHQKADILLNHYCNPILAQSQKLPKNASCCVPSGPEQRGQWVILAVSIIGILAALISLLSVKSDTDESPRAMSKEMSQAVLVFCSVLLFCFETDQTQAFGKLIKQHDKVQFEVLCVVALVLVLLADLVKVARKLTSKSLPLPSHKSESSALLSHGQTEEWKGWMQAVILLYHWTGTSSNLNIYKFIRLLVAAYLFMSGYGTTLAILKTEGSLFKKMCRQLIRLNILSLALSYIMATSYLDYYFAPLVSMWLFATYTCLGVFRSWNDSISLVTLKIVLCCSLTSFVIFKNGIIETLFYALEQTCNISLNAKEWRFRVGLDSFIVYVGIFTAVLVVKLRSAEKDIESGTKEEYAPRDDSQGWRWQGLVSRLNQESTLLTTSINVLTGASLIASWTFVASRLDAKASYNALHPYISPLPVIGFVFLRQCHPYLRKKHSAVFARLGRCSLETFTLQFHLLLANNTAATLSFRFLPQLPRLGSTRVAELCIIMLAFLFISEKVAQASGVMVSLMSELETSSSATVNQYSIVAQGEEDDEPETPSSGSLYEDGLILRSNEVLQSSPWHSFTSLIYQYQCHRITAAVTVLVIFNWLGYSRH